MAVAAQQVLGVTGHRDISHSPETIKIYLREVFKKLKPNRVLTGMAQGFDQIVAEICVEMNIDFIAALPFESMEKHWTKKDQETYKNLLKSAKSIHCVTDGDYQKWKYLKRDEWIANNCDELIAYLDDRGKGGTYYTVNFFEALPLRKKAYNLFNIINS
jgi:uncharacterized phage-like protein YoqJ